MIIALEWRPLAVESYQLSSHLQFQDEHEIELIIDRYRTTSLLFIDLKQIQTELTSLPWVSEVTVEKKWPGSLAIDVVEHQPIARWNGEKVLNSEGIPLNDPNIAFDLVSLTGPAYSAEKVMDQYLQFSRIFDSLGLHLQGVTMHPRGSWSLTLDTGITIALGDKNVLERSRRVVRVIQSASFDSEEIEYIDARYTNGVAIRLAS